MEFNKDFKASFVNMFKELRETMLKEVKGASLVARWLRICLPGFPGGAVVENLPADAGDTGSSPGLGRSHMPRSN